MNHNNKNQDRNNGTRQLRRRTGGHVTIVSDDDDNDNEVNPEAPQVHTGVVLVDDHDPKWPSSASPTDDNHNPKLDSDKTNFDQDSVEATVSVSKDETTNNNNTNFSSTGW
eukprot:CAMPEP_0168789584 /NCGR_PEP_ID=MMETSP0725-20121227/12930_1 /TAXON_ID=265536 /ORGANISM="Amphiprora sp., Strain CCMP467" /LENGTH=110 /DNA_ID=CAMNT_0008839903 /DNA_START=85 /DNA_END=414 /DNA_ORIENTATION=-